MKVSVLVFFIDLDRLCVLTRKGDLHHIHLVNSGKSITSPNTEKLTTDDTDAHKSCRLILKIT